ncbi:hypothetical protein O3P69_000966 [Scylla paramamosain]|uniref:Uncharacterized protein n=1 Tax=Scylla paramamosain TaxID=85552 RepID=A0AAW0USM0_SCYPA
MRWPSVPWADLLLTSRLQVTPGWLMRLRVTRRNLSCANPEAQRYESRGPTATSTTVLQATAAAATRTRTNEDSGGEGGYAEDKGGGKGRETSWKRIGKDERGKGGREEGNKETRAKGDEEVREEKQEEAGERYANISPRLASPTQYLAKRVFTFHVSAASHGVTGKEKHGSAFPNPPYRAGPGWDSGKQTGRHFYGVPGSGGTGTADRRSSAPNPLSGSLAWAWRGVEEEYHKHHGGEDGRRSYGVGSVGVGQVAERSPSWNTRRKG